MSEFCKNCRNDIIYHYTSFPAQRGMAEFNWSGGNNWWIYGVVMDCDVQLENELKIDIDTHREREREREMTRNQWDDVGCIATL